MESEGSLPRLQQPISCPARKPDQSSAQTPHFAWIRREILKRIDWILYKTCHWAVGGMYFRTRDYETHLQVVDCVWNVMAHAQKPDFVFRRNGRVHLNRRGLQFSWLLAGEVCASAVGLVVMLDTPCSEVVWRVLATHSIRQFSLHFPSRASPCAITFQLEYMQGYDQIHASIPCISAFTSDGFRACTGQHTTKLSTYRPTHTVFR
jgi:hypothetical protein